MKGLALSIFVGVLLATGTASAELSQHGELFVHFDGGISPRKLPRHEFAPVAVRVEGTIHSPAGDSPPPLRGIEVGFNSGARLTTAGLPVCSQGQIQSSLPGEALKTCGSALIGSGGITARTSFGEKSGSLLRGEVLLFNSRSDGRRAMLGYIYQRRPVQLTRFLTFSIRHRGGAFGTAIAAKLSPAFNRNGSLESFFFRIGRSFTVDGRRQAYLSAACSAPAGIQVASFPFARISMSFAGGTTISSKLIRSCAVRR